MVKVKYLTKRAGSDNYQYVRNIKPQHRHLFGGKRQIWKSLRTTDQSVAIRSAISCSEWFDEVIQAGPGSLNVRATGLSGTPPSEYFDSLLPSALDNVEWAEHLAGLDRDRIMSLVAQEREKYASTAALRDGLQDKIDGFADRLLFAVEAIKSEESALGKQMHRANIIGMQGLIEQYNLMRAVLLGGDISPVNSELYVPLTQHVGGRSLGELAKRYFKDHIKSNNARTRMQQRSRLEVLIEALGRDRDISHVKSVDILEVKNNLLPNLPTRNSKKTAAMPIKDRAEYASRNGLPVLSLKTQGLYFWEWKAFFKSEPVVDILGKNILDRVFFQNIDDDEVMREGFTVDELEALFTAPVFKGCAGEADGDWKRPGSVILRNHKFWVPLISLFSGMTVAEICELEKKDVKRLKKFFVMKVRPEARRGRTVKTKSRIRDVPVHPKLVEFGFLDYVAGLADGPLFPDLCDGANNPSAAFGKWFGHFRLSVGVDRESEPKVSFHSFRHTFREGCRDCDIPDHAAKRIGGWKLGSDDQSRYGTKDIAKLYEHLAKLDYPELDLSHLLGQGGSDLRLVPQS